MNLRYTTGSLDEVMSRWLELLEATPGHSVFQRPEWHRALIGHLVHEVAFHVFSDERGPAALFPLSSSSEVFLGFREAQLPAHTELFVRDCLIADEFTSLPWENILARHVRTAAGSAPAAFRFHRVAATSSAARIFDSRTAAVRRAASGGQAYCDVRTAQSLDSLSAKHLRNVERLRRRAIREVGGIDRAVYTGPDAADIGFAIFSQVEAASWKGASGTRTSVSCRPRVESFYRSALQGFAQLGAARVDVLIVEDRPAAAMIALRAESVWNVLKVGFDETYSWCGPGNILLLEFLKEACASPSITTVSLVTTPEWASRWHMKHEPSFDIAVFPATRKGAWNRLRHDTIHALQRKTRVAHAP